MKPNSYKAIIATSVALFALQIVFAQKPIPVPQTDWIRNGKDTIWTPKFVGIKTNSPDAPLEVAGKIIADTIKIDVIKVGNNSLWIGNPTLQTQIGGADVIQSDMGIINFGNYNSPFSNIKVGIGNTAPVDALDVTGAIALNDLKAISFFGF